MNRDEALRCVKIAENEFQAKNYNKAYKFILKAKNMDSTLVSDGINDL